MIALTEKQHAISAYCADYLRRNDMFPTTRTLADHLGVAQTAAVDHLKALDAKGVIEKNEAGRYRFCVRPSMTF